MTVHTIRSFSCNAQCSQGELLILRAHNIHIRTLHTLVHERVGAQSKLVGGCLAVYRRLARRRQGLFVSFSHACMRIRASIMPRNTQPGELVTTLDM